MKNKVNFLWKGFRLCALIAFVSLIAFSIASCEVDSGGDSGTATLTIKNDSPQQNENIRRVIIGTTDGKKHDTKDVTIIPGQKQSFSLEPDEYVIVVECNTGRSDYESHKFSAGEKRTLSWLDGYLDW